MNNRRINRKRYSRTQIVFNRILVIAIILLIIAIISFALKNMGGQSRNSQPPQSSSQSASLPSSSAAAPESSSSSSSSLVIPAVTDIPLLVNKDNPIPEDFKPDLVNIDSGKQMDRTAAEAFNKMKQAYAEYARSNGYGEKDAAIWAQSPYRSHERQTTLWTKGYNENKSKLGTDEAAYVETAKLTAYPGTSEHETGLAVDINIVGNSFENTKQFKWLIQNCADYGFILRYPRDKVSITSIDYEPWHYRYVGVEHARYIMQNNLCLEEYVELLKKQSN
ncbi:MAG TPA: hypothetical protein DCP97_03685 [Ruminococcaceae bacterium]|nr:hypothetical protein [Oscillospiraceae bacterium]